MSEKYHPSTINSTDLTVTYVPLCTIIMGEGVRDSKNIVAY